MSRTEQDGYFVWLVDLIDDGTKAYTYSSLLNRLYFTPFRWTIDNDGNREIDGIELRHKYIQDFVPFDTDDISDVGNEFCSVLEVLVSLAIRMEDILYDPDFGTQIPVWFWTMIDNLGLSRATDEVFDDASFFETMYIFLGRGYDSHGFGSIFYTNRDDLDFKKMELWYQMMHFIDENYL